MSGGPDVSVVVPTYNRRERLDRVLTSLAEQRDAPPFEVIVVSDGSTDGTSEYLATGTPMEVTAIDQDNSGPAAARNAGVRAAQAPLLVFLDDDVIARPDLIAQHHAAHLRIGEGHVVIGPMSTPRDTRLSPWIRWEQAKLERQYENLSTGRWPVTPRQFYTGNVSMARDLVTDNGGFDESYRRAEDVEFGLRLARAGVRFAFAPDAAGMHYAERSYESWRNIAYSYGRNDVRMAEVYPDLYPLETIRRKFKSDHVLLACTTRVALHRPAVHRLLERTLRGVALSGDRLGLRIVPSLALSAIYAADYYRGVADELGGLDAFRELLRGTRPEHEPTA